MSKKMNAVLAIAGAAMAFGAQAQITTELFVSGLSSPVGMYPAPGDDRLFVIQQSGEIRTITNGAVDPGNLLDLSVRSGSELGLLGLAFHPDFAANGRFFVNYNPGGLSTRTRISEFTMDLGTGQVSPATERILLEIAQPFSNHNGGWMDFGQDGYLYIATGDGGSGNDPQNHSSRLNTLLGKMLRIDVDTDDFPADALRNYGIPASNPFVGDTAALDEIWAYGLRNPFRNSFDMVTGDLWMGDVGQNAREEVNFQPVDSLGGEHYGWRCREGLRQNFADTGCFPPAEGFVDPVVEYTHSSGRCSITGGFRYRGCEVPELDGKYIFGDFCTGEIFSIDADNPGALSVEADLTNFVLGSFAQDVDGELYVVYLNGQIRKIVSQNPVDTDGDGIPDSCETECIADVNGDGDLNGLDFGAWLSAFNAGDLSADQNGDGMVNGIDFGSWLSNFNAGCD